MYDWEVINISDSIYQFVVADNTEELEAKIKETIMVNCFTKECEVKAIHRNEEIDNLNLTKEAVPGYDENYSAIVILEKD